MQTFWLIQLETQWYETSSEQKIYNEDQRGQL